MDSKGTKILRWSSDRYRIEERVERVGRGGRDKKEEAISLVKQAYGIILLCLSLSLPVRFVHFAIRSENCNVLLAFFILLDGCNLVLDK